jgi:hypothetical protein
VVTILRVIKYLSLRYQFSLMKLNHHYLNQAFWIFRWMHFTFSCLLFCLFLNLWKLYWTFGSFLFPFQFTFISFLHFPLVILCTTYYQSLQKNEVKVSFNFLVLFQLSVWNILVLYQDRTSHCLKFMNLQQVFVSVLDLNLLLNLIFQIIQFDLLDPKIFLHFDCYDN